MTPYKFVALMVGASSILIAGIIFSNSSRTVAEAAPSFDTQQVGPPSPAQTGEMTLDDVSNEIASLGLEVDPHCDSEDCFENYENHPDNLDDVSDGSDDESRYVKYSGAQSSGDALMTPSEYSCVIDIKLGNINEGPEYTACSINRENAAEKAGQLELDQDQRATSDAMELVMRECGRPDFGDKFYRCLDRVLDR